LLRSAEALELRPNDITFMLSGDTSLPGRASAWEIGVVSFCVSDVLKNVSPLGKGVRYRVRLQIRKDKTNQQGRDIHRFLDCVCPLPFGTNIVPLCPVHCAARLCFRHTGSKHSLCDQGIGMGSLSPSQYLNCLRTLISAAGIQRTDLFNGESVERFGTHSLRRGGAQALAMGGWSLDAIKFFGRWLSNAVELYLLDIPFRTDGHKLAASMVQQSSLSGESVLNGMVQSPRNMPLQIGSRIKVMFPAPLEVAPILGCPKADVSAGDFAWFEVRVIRMAGNCLGELPGDGFFAHWDSPTNEELRTLKPVDLCPVNCCAVIPLTSSVGGTALCFNTVNFVWMRL